MAKEAPGVSGGAQREPAFLWFTRGGCAYLVTDGPSLRRVGRLAGESEAGLGQQLRELADELLESGVARPAGDLHP
jgi:hypothetical protein